MSVVDASLWVDVAIQRTRSAVLPGVPTTVPSHFDGEVLASFRGLVRGGKLSGADAADLLTGLQAAPLLRVPLAELVLEAWQLSEAVSAYDAFYVALARREQTVFFTSDAKLAAGAADLCDVRLVR